MKKNIWTYLALLCLAYGMLGVLNKYLISGESAFGTSSALPWGSLIAAYVFFAVSATGTGLVASLGHVFRIKKFEALTKRALLASILLLTAGFGILAIELSNPFKMIWLLFTPNPASPIFWMGVFYGLYLILLLAEFYFTLKNMHVLATVIAHASFLVKLAAVINLGRVFGFSMTRGFWQGYYYSAYMVVSALVSGAAILLVILYLQGRDKAAGQAQDDLSSTLGKILAGALILLGTMQFLKFGSALISGDPTLLGAAKSILIGPAAPSFWLLEIGLGMILPLGILFSSRFSSCGHSFLAAAFTMLGLLFSRLNFVYAGLAVPLQALANGTPAGSYNSYTSTWSEWSLIIGALGFIILMFNLAESKLTLDSHN